MLDFPTLQTLVAKLRENPHACPILETPRDQANYFMIAGHILATEAAAQSPTRSEATVNFGIRGATPNETAEDWHRRANQAFRTAITRNKKRLTDRGTTIVDFRATHVGYSLSNDSDANPILIETYTYSFNPIVSQMTAELLQISSDLIS